MPPTLSKNSIIWDYDKLGHFMMFAAWTFSFGLAFSLIKKKPLSWWGTILAGIFFGLLIEILQKIMPFNRSFEWLDVLADALGALSAGVLLRFLYKPPKTDKNKKHKTA